MVWRRGAFHGETENICSEMRAILGEARGIYGEGRTVGVASFRLLGLGFNHVQGFAHRAGIGVKRRAHRLAQRVRQTLQPVGTLPAKRLALLLDLRLTTAACEVEARGRLKLLACGEARTILSRGQGRRYVGVRVRIIFACSGRHFSCPTFLVSGRAIWRMSQHEGPFPSPSSRCRNRASPSCGPYAPNRSEEHTSELQSPCNLVCRLLLEKKNAQYVEPRYARPGIQRDGLERPAASWGADKDVPEPTRRRGIGPAGDTSGASSCSASDAVD